MIDDAQFSQPIRSSAPAQQHGYVIAKRRRRDPDPMSTDW